MKLRKGPLGAHFFDRDSGLNILADEISFPECEWSQAPRYVSIALTNSCDLSCSYCYAPKHSSGLKYDDVLRWAIEFERAGCLGIGLGGGEPTIYRELGQIISELSTETSLALTMTTHGHRFTSNLSDALVGRINFIRVSMDGIGSTYEKLRNRSFTSFLEKLSIIRRTAPYGINYVVNDFTIHEIDEAADLAFKLGARDFLLLPEVDSKGKLNLEPATTDKLSFWVESNYANRRLAISTNGVEVITSPVLPIADPRGPTYDLVHIDALGYLRTTAFADDGVCLDQEISLNLALCNLRSLAHSTHLEEK